METWQIALLIYLALFAMTLLFVALTAALLRLVGGRATAIQLGTPPLVTLRRAAPRIRLGPIPLGSVEMLGASQPAEVSPGEHDWRRLGSSRQLLVTLGPWLAIAAITVALLGPSHTGRSFASALNQLLLTLDPTPLVRRFLALAASAPPSVVVGILLAKLVVLNLLPFGSFAGGQIVTVLASAGKRETPKAVQLWLIASMAFSLFYVSGRFAYAFIRVLV